MRAWFLLPLLLLGACNPGAKPDHPVVLIGFDGLEWKVAAPLVRDGKMPNLRKLIERGVAGSLLTMPPALSPVCWTTMAPGQQPRDHGIDNFLDAHMKPFTSNARACKALWNIVSDHGLKTLCVGWWVTWPAEEIEGWMVAPYSAAGQLNVNWKGNMYPGLPDQTWPRALFDEIWPLAEDVHARRDDIARGYFPTADDPALTDVEREKLIAHTRWSVDADETYLAVATHLLERPDIEPDLTMVYFGGTDVSSHRFWRYMEPESFRYPIPERSIELLGDTIERFYERADAMLGEVLARVILEDANVIVCSDHGFHAEATEQEPADGWSGHHLDGPPGVIVMAGPDVKPGFGIADALAGKRPPELGNIWDVAPVTLFLLGIPPGRDMIDPTGGPLLKNAVRDELRQARRLDPIFHDKGFRPASTPRQASDGTEEQFLQWMKENGYLDG